MISFFLGWPKIGYEMIFVENGNENAFQIMKDALSKSTLLIFPEPTKQYHVFTDASDIGIIVVLA